MEPAIKVALAALTISLFSLIITFVNSVYSAKTYKRNRRLEFLQRRDLLSQKISALNDRNTEFQLISARFETVAVKNSGLAVRGEHVEQNAAIIGSIKRLREGVETGIALWDENIEKLYVKYNSLTRETDAPEVEKMIDLVNVASDNLKKAYNGYSSTLHILESNNEWLKTTLAELDQKLRQIDIDFEGAIEKLRSIGS
jgi:hypothetical protein